MTIDIHTGGAGDSFEFEGSQQLDLGPDYSLAEPALIKGKCIRVQDNAYIVSGRMKLWLTGACARCVEPAEFRMDISFEERFEREYSDEDHYAYNGDSIDITKALSDNAFLNLPSRILCRDDCAGLCPVCGGNLNEMACGCATEAAGAFDELRRLRLPDMSDMDDMKY